MDGRTSALHSVDSWVESGGFNRCGSCVDGVDIDVDGVDIDVDDVDGDGVDIDVIIFILVHVFLFPSFRRVGVTTILIAYVGLYNDD